MGPPRPEDLFAADSDVAALVYQRAAPPDALLRRFISDVTAEGGRVAGLLQRRSADGTRLSFTLLPGAGAIGDGVPCAEALAAAGPRLSAALRRRPDLFVVNRFGSAELSGGGLLGVLVEAVERGIPVLIAVPDGLFDAWLGFSAGLAVRLDGRAGLDRWWASLRRPPPWIVADRACEQFK